MARSDKLIVNLCPTGMVPRRVKVPNVPITPREIAADVRRCRDVGASVVHLHAREDDEQPTWRRELFQEICDAVVDVAPDIVVVVTTSGRLWSDFERRSESLGVEGRAKPEMASLTLGSMNFATGPSVNSPDMIRRLAEAMTDRGIVPELEVFDVGMANFARHLADEGMLRAPFYANLLVGSRGTADLNAANLTAMVTSLPEGTTWALAGIGRHQTSAHAVAIGLGGHIRVGLEDNPYFDWETHSAATNPALVERSVKIAAAVGREPATPEETRRIIGLKPVDRT